MFRLFMNFLGTVTSPVRGVVNIPTVSVNPRTGRISVEKPNTASDNTVEVEAQRSNEAEVGSTASPTVVPATALRSIETYTLTGTIKKANKSKFPNVAISVYDKEQGGELKPLDIHTVSSEDGEFTISIPASNPEVTLVFSYPDFVTEKQPATKDGAGASLEVVLKKA